MPAPDLIGWQPGDPGVTWDIAASEITADWKHERGVRAFAGERIRVADPRASPQLLSHYGLSRAEVARRVPLLEGARRGDAAARRELARRYGVRVYQRPEIARMNGGNGHVHP